MRGWIVALLLAASACVHQPVFHTFRLSGPVLVPPGVGTAETALRKFNSDVPAGKGSCAAQAPALQRRGKKLLVTVDRAALIQHTQPGWLSNWTMQAEADGCI